MYNYAFIATQNDKIKDAFTAFNELFNEMPVSQNAFELAKEGAKISIATSRITKMSILNTYIRNRELGYDYDYRKDFYNAIDQFTIEDIVAFNHEYIRNKPKTYMILSNESDVDFDALTKDFGKVNKLTLEDIFGY
jgi:predicted Zn-dependent peptidase